MLPQRVLAFAVVGTLLVFTLAAPPSSGISGTKKDYNSSSSPSSSSSEETSDVQNFPVNGLPPLTYSKKKYTFYEESGVTFYSAWQACRSMGKRLATIESYQDYLEYRKAVYPHVNYEIAHWIAATNVGARENAYDKFYWITNDRPVGYLSGFQMWIEGVAPSESEVCVATYLGDASWIYGACDNENAFACEDSPDV